MTPPKTPAELRETLLRIFPSLPRDFGASGESVFEAVDPTFHSVMREFAFFFGRRSGECSDRQLRRFAELVGSCVAAPGALADAMDTCFLAQAREAKSDRRFLALLPTSIAKSHDGPADRA